LFPVAAPLAAGQEPPAPEGADVEPPAPELPATDELAPEETEPEEPAPETPARGAQPEESSLSDSESAPAPRTPEQIQEDYELLKLFADTLDQIDRNYVQKVSRRELMEAAIEGMMTRLDPYSNYIAPDELDRFKSTVESEFGGIGIQIGVKDGELLITSPLYGAPAYRAGLMAGDRITQIGGDETKDFTIEDAVRKLKGKPGDDVSLTVLRPGETTPRTVVLKREIIRVKTVLGDRHKPDDSWNYVYDENRKIGYIRVTAFSRHTTQELRQALEELKGDGLAGLVLDLRFNPGGLLTTAIEVSDLFLTKGVIVSTEGRNSPKRSWDAKAPGTFDGFPMAVLVNHYSASASEIVSACLQDHHRAIVVGERSWGKGSVQNVIDLENGKSALKLTTAGYLRPSGKNIHRPEDAPEEGEWGVAPNEGYAHKFDDAETRRYLEWRRERDILKKSIDPNVEAGFTDAQLEKALDYLRREIDKTKSDSSLAQGEVVQPVQPPAPE
jgi:carboxyl-terminal processing protease